MFEKTPTYVGNGHYCYANATAMLLASVGERFAPGLVEVLSGVSLGAGWNEQLDLIFFDSSAPDVGISRAIRLLGFEVTEQASADGEPAPLAKLAAALKHGPALLGPMDMGLLLYQPGKGRPSGVDHYVLAYAADADEVYLHDPAGYPSVSLRWDDLAASWAAEQVGYRRGMYRWWHAPRRVTSPSDDARFARVLAAFAEVYHLADRHAEATGRCIGGAAIRRLADRVRAGDLPPHLLGHLRGFTFQVGARRAHDFAQFFGERAPELAALKDKQGRLFGRVHTLLVRQDWGGTAETLSVLAEAEERFRAQVVGAAVAA